jgi:2-amino-4-hydroxy-6-hydroxymethyldihydropteridine diphosphokinase
MKKEHQVCLLLGSNIEPEQNLKLAIELLRKKVRTVQVSSVWETPSKGSPGPNFLNCAMLVTTTLEAKELKERVLRPLEAQLGRERTADKNAPRTIDIDIVLYDDKELDPDLWFYAHRAVPVSEILPGYRSAEGRPLSRAAFELVQTNAIRLRRDVVTENPQDVTYQEDLVE